MGLNRGAKGKKPSSPSRLSPYLRGIVVGLALAGFSQRKIADEVVKPDGEHPCQQSIADVLCAAEAVGTYRWNGEADTCQNSRPRATSKAFDKKILDIVFKNRGRAIVNVNYIKKVYKAARKVSNRLLQRRLSEAGLAWLRRRRKSLVPAAHKVARLDFAAWTLCRTAATLVNWAFTDGTTFYLARSSSELESKQRAALGQYVWRQANGNDGLYEECVGPSGYAKSQGTSVRIWGLLVAGVLFVYVLPDGVVMNQVWYQWVVKTKFPQWLRKALGRRRAKKASLVQDHERCLWATGSQDAIKAIGVKLLANYPKCSQDLNPIETAWREIRARLAVTMPRRMEDRASFVARLRTTVAWINRNRRDYLRQLCAPETRKQWSRDVQAMNGGRTSH